MAKTRNVREITHSPVLESQSAAPQLPSPVPETPPDSPIVAATVEQPLPLMMAEISLWGLAVGLVAVPLTALGLAAAPAVFASRLLPSRLLHG